MDGLPEAGPAGAGPPAPTPPVLDDALAEPAPRAAQHGRSMEEEVRTILRTALAEEPPPASLAEAIRRRLAPLGGVELEFPPRGPAREPPRFEERSSSTRACSRS